MNRYTQPPPTGANPPVQTGGEQKPSGAGQPKMPPRRTWLWFLLILAVNYLLMRNFFPSPSAPAKVPYTLFKQEVANNNVEAIYTRGETITGRLVKPVKYAPRPKSDRPTPSPSPIPIEVRKFTTILPSFVDDGLEAY